MKLDQELFIAALTNPTQRPRARANLQDHLAQKGTPGAQLQQGTTYTSLFTAAVQHGWEEAVGDLLAAGADVHANNDEALHYAAGSGHLPVVEALLAAGADPCVSREAPLRYAASRGHLSVAERLLSAGANAPRAVMISTARFRPQVCRTLDTVAAAIPADQRPALLAMRPSSFPSLRAMVAAERRSHIRVRKT